MSLKIHLGYTSHHANKLKCSCWVKSNTICMHVRRDRWKKERPIRITLLKIASPKWRDLIGGQSWEEPWVTIIITDITMPGPTRPDDKIWVSLVFNSAEVNRLEPNHTTARHWTRGFLSTHGDELKYKTNLVFLKKDQRLTFFLTN